MARVPFVARRTVIPDRVAIEVFHTPAATHAVRDTVFVIGDFAQDERRWIDRFRGLILGNEVRQLNIVVLAAAGEKNLA